MAKVLSSISGNLISAASAGYAPTNSADVSAIASAYQVVSATATQLYAGTAYLTSVNDAPVSASRAGQAANASMATSAYYDGTGRLISALPDAAEVSSIASSYAESAASGKADSSSLSSYALSSDVSGVIDTVSANSASWSGGTLPISGSASNDSATYDVNGIVYEHASIDEFDPNRFGYVSPERFRIDCTTPGGDYFGVNLTETALEFSDQNGYHTVDGISIDTWNSAVDTVANNSASWGQGGVDSATVSAIASSYAESAVSSKADSSALSSYAKSADVSAAVNKVTSMSGNWNTTYNTVFYNSAYWTTGYTTVRDNSASWGQSGVDSATVSAIASSYAESAVSSKQDSSAMSAYALSSDVSGVIDTVSSNSASWGQGGVVTSTGSSTYWSAGNEYTVVNSINGSSLGAVTSYSANSAYQAVYDQSGRRLDYLPDTAKVSAIASSYAESAVSSKQDSSAMSAYALSSDVSGVIDTVSANSAAWGQGGVDSATVSSIASSYAESAASSKMDTSAMTSYTLSADVSGTVDLVSSQSANWGGSALALSAGPGVKLEKVGNTLVVGADETVLWESAAGRLLAQGITLNESRLNFEMLRFYMGTQTTKSVISYDMPMYGLNRTEAFAIQPSMPFMDTAGTGFAINWQIAISATETTMSSVQALYWGKSNFGSANTASGAWTQGANNAGVPIVYKVIGINRTAGV